MVFVGLAISVGVVSVPAQNPVATSTTPAPQAAIHETIVTSSKTATESKTPVTVAERPVVVEQVVAPVATQPEETQPAPAPIVPVQPAPANTTSCNGVYYPNCSVGQDFICPAVGGAYCKTSAQQEAQNEAIAAQQERSNEISSLIASCNSQMESFEDQVATIQGQYQNSQYAGAGGNAAEYAAIQQNLANQANAKIAPIKQQEQQLYSNCQARLDALR